MLNLSEQFFALLQMLRDLDDQAREQQLVTFDAQTDEQTEAFALWYHPGTQQLVIWQGQLTRDPIGEQLVESDAYLTLSLEQASILAGFLLPLVYAQELPWTELNHITLESSGDVPSPIIQAITA